MRSEHCLENKYNSDSGCIVLGFFFSFPYGLLEAPRSTFPMLFGVLSLCPSSGDLHELFRKGEVLEISKRLTFLTLDCLLGYIFNVALLEYDHHFSNP